MLQSNLEKGTRESGKELVAIVPLRSDRLSNTVMADRTYTNPRLLSSSSYRSSYINLHLARSDKINLLRKILVDNLDK